MATISTARMAIKKKYNMPVEPKEDSDTKAEEASDKKKGIVEDESDDVVAKVGTLKKKLSSAKQKMYKKYPHLDPMSSIGGY